MKVITLVQVHTNNDHASRQVNHDKMHYRRLICSRRLWICLNTTKTTNSDLHNNFDHIDLHWVYQQTTDIHTHTPQVPSSLPFGTNVVPKSRESIWRWNGNYMYLCRGILVTRANLSALVLPLIPTWLGIQQKMIL